MQNDSQMEAAAAVLAIFEKCEKETGRASLLDVRAAIRQPIRRGGRPPMGSKETQARREQLRLAALLYAGPDTASFQAGGALGRALMASYGPAAFVKLNRLEHLSSAARLGAVLSLEEYTEWQTVSKKRSTAARAQVRAVNLPGASCAVSD